MNTRIVTKYESPLRAEQAQATRERILVGVRTMFERDPANALGFDELATVSGVNRRTIFRHFPTKEALLEAFWNEANASLGVRFWPESEKDLTELPPALFASLDSIEGIVRASHASGAGRQMRLQANDERQAAFRKSLAEISKDLTPEGARQLEATVQLLFSATAWQTMKDYWGLPGEEAGKAAAWAIKALLDAARRNGQNRTEEPK
ncbi:TetR/AcrR family transcriptional regulator [Rhizobium mesosinicum]|uniref:TetR/AcrR family transcriptional regulator n=1 Tax=Rhizobium mesosinicum TaxID=335017 RepID=A0ABS7GXA3_9HYPH|nr:TetR/AcrR family transcriptional regulator [Rhizobium mesosinicum]MBW9053938.1 TetR/AcrR family transcriptional regulator [Rhizobium mesosinicum]